jgi:hypothetical protein
LPLLSPPPIVIAPASIHLTVLGVNDCNDDCIPSLIISSRKSVARLQNSRLYLLLMPRGGEGYNNCCG